MWDNKVGVWFFSSFHSAFLSMYLSCLVPVAIMSDCLDWGDWEGTEIHKEYHDNMLLGCQHAQVAKYWGLHFPKYV